MNLKDSLFNIHLGEQETPYPGSLLIAEPFLAEPYFNHSVILMLEGDGGENESMGIVLNINSHNTLQSLIKGIEAEAPIDVYCGGPVGLDRLYFLHTLGDLIENSQEVGSTGLYVGGNFESIINYINSGYPVEGNLRFFVGYSGWSQGQLNEELSQNVWAVANPRDVGTVSDLLTGEENYYWHRTINALGEKYRWWRMFPKDITSN